MPFHVSPMLFPINIVGKILLQSKLLEKFFNFLISEVQLGNISALQRKRKKLVKALRWPGIEPGSTAWKAAMLTTIPPTQTHFLSVPIYILIASLNCYVGFNFFFADEIFFDRKSSSKKKPVINIVIDKNKTPLFRRLDWVIIKIGLDSRMRGKRKSVGRRHEESKGTCCLE